MPNPMDTCLFMPFSWRESNSERVHSVLLDFQNQYLFLASLSVWYCVGFLWFWRTGASLVAEHGLQAGRHRQLQHVSSGVVAHSLSCPAACGIFPDQESNLCPLHWQADSQPLDYQESPVLLDFFFFFFKEFLLFIFFFFCFFSRSQMKILMEKRLFCIIILHHVFFNYSWYFCLIILAIITVTFSRRQEFSLYAFYTRNSSVLEIVLVPIHQDKGKSNGGY